MKVEIWGTYPPPIGGVSMHVFRLIHNIHLLDSKIILKNFGFVDPKFSYIKTPKFKSLEFIRLLYESPKLIHLHSNNIYFFALLLFFGFRHKLGVTIHNMGMIKIKSRIKRKIVDLFFKRASFIILNDENYKNILVKTFNCKSNKFYILPAFIPPIEIEYKGLSKDIIEFRENHKFLISANAYKLRFENNVDIYGFDLLISLVYELKKKGIDVGLLFCLPMIGDNQYYEHCLSSILEKGISNNIMIIQRNLTNGFEVWKLSDLFIRPTTTDMEGISVKEALYCGTPAIASDVCTRPNEAILFKNRDLNDLINKVQFVYEQLKNKNNIKIRFNKSPVNDILNIYRSMN